MTLSSTTMHIVRYETSSGPRIGTQVAGVTRRADVPSFAHLLTLGADEFRRVLDRTANSGDIEEDVVRLLPPVDGLTEVWASGVTYRRSKDARVEESAVANVYNLVYDAPRPELFFKSVAWRVVGDGEPIGVRADSLLNVPEPELGLVVNSGGEIVGLTVSNDISSRSIEGENPLYLPQAKVFAGACALGPVVVPAWTLAGTDLAISVHVHRGLATVWKATTSTSLMHRSFEDLVGYLYRADRFPCGVVLSTGTGLVPAMDVTLQEGDVGAISIEGIGTLTNTVRVGRDAFDWIPVPGMSRNAGQRSSEGEYR